MFCIVDVLQDPDLAAATDTLWCRRVCARARVCVRVWGVYYHGLEIRAMVGLWHSWVLQQNFWFGIGLTTTVFLTFLLRGCDGERKSWRILPNTNTFIPNDRSQCLCYVLPTAHKEMCRVPTNLHGIGRSSRLCVGTNGGLDKAKTL